MKHIKKSPIIFGLLSLIAIFAYAKQEKVLQIFRNGEIIQEYAVDEIDYIEVNDLIGSPSGVRADVRDNQITISWNKVDGATYNIYRSPDNVNFNLLTSNLTETTYTDTNPLKGTNYYKIKAIVNGVESGYSSSAAGTLADSGLESGIYLGITGFNQALYNYPVIQVSESSVEGFHEFIDGLTMKNGTLLYYSVDQAINTLQATQLPSDLSTAAIVTFTDGLDQGSFMMDIPYNDNNEYLDALNARIKNEKVCGQSIAAYSIGIRSQDVMDVNMFQNNLKKLASSDANAFEVTSMSEVNARFKEIAEELSQSNYVQNINIDFPGVPNGTIVRITFDNVNDASKSNLYIEGSFNRSALTLEGVKYVGMTSTSGSTLKGTQHGIFVNYTIEGVHTDNNILISSKFIDEWTYVSSNNSWQKNSEFVKDENSRVETERSSAVIMLVLDCSSSLAGDFATAQNNAKDFINTLYEAVGGDSGSGENPGGNDNTIYTTTPTDLSVAIWQDGTRYYLTPEQYKNANLTNATIEGLTVLSNMGDFIISPYNIQTGNVRKSSALKYYTNLLPDKNQATVISARYLDINNKLNSIGWEKFGTGQYDYYFTKTAYNSTFNYSIHLYRYNGGNLAGSNEGSYYNSTYCQVRGVMPINHEGPIKWNNDNDLSLSVIKDGVRMFIKNNTEDLSQYDEIEGVYVTLGDQRFIIKLQNEQSGSITVSSAMSLYSEILPNYTQAEIISMKSSQINSALNKFGGAKFANGQYDYYMTNSSYSTTYNYQIHLYRYAGGDLAGSNEGSYYNSEYGLIRGVKTLD
ncbi:MAG: hypothetical protein J1F05_01400 [Muribaculaceae bacterium]|nr:hypothetical protein [Muribaculaceae bacterium]